MISVKYSESRNSEERFPKVVLGGLIKRGTLTSSDDADNIITPGVYECHGVPNTPVPTNWGLLMVFPEACGVTCQIWTTNTKDIPASANYFYIRKNIGSNTWSSWFNCNSFGCPSPKELASLLGGGMPQALTGNEDLDDFRKGTYQVNSHTLSHAPNTNAAIIWHTDWANGFWGAQFYLDKATHDIYIRESTSNGYDSSWYKIQTTQVQ